MTPQHELDTTLGSGSTAGQAPDRRTLWRDRRPSARALIAATALVAALAVPFSSVTSAQASTIVSLSASPTSLIIGSPTTLTATTSVNIGPTPFYTEIFDKSTGKRLVVCSTGTTCSVSVFGAMGTQQYISYVSADSAAFPPPDIQATSNVVDVTWTRPLCHGTTCS
jgi:hypothetical protein